MDTQVRQQAAALVRAAITASGLTMREVSRRSGVSLSTINRLLHGSTAASLDTLDDLLAATGHALTLSAPPTATVEAIAAVRYLVDHEDHLDSVAGPWIDRLISWSTGTDGLNPVTLLREAAAAANPAALPGAVALSTAPRATGPSPLLTLGRVASAASTDGHPWALSGSAALTRPPFGDPLPSRTIAWVSEPASVRRHLPDLPTTASHRADLILAPAPDWLFDLGTEHDRIHYVSDLQCLVDSLALGGEAARLAEQRIARSA